MTNVPASGWLLEVEHPDRSTPRRLSVVGEPTITPSANAKPTATIPVRRDEYLLDKSWQGQTLRLWHDGQRVSVGEFQSANLTPGSTEITAVGGSELDKRVQLDIDRKAVWKTARDVIQNNTSYTAAVDQQPTTTDTNVVLQDNDTGTDLRNALTNLTDTIPLVVQNGKVLNLDASWFSEGENNDGGFGGGDVSDSAASEGTAESLFDSTHDPSYDVSIGYPLPADHVGVAFRIKDTDSSNGGPETDVLVDGVRQSVLGDGFQTSGYSWFQVTGWGNAGLSDLSSGSHTITIDATTSTGSANLDAVVLYDTRYSFTFDNSVDSNNLLAGPEPKPDALTAIFENVFSARVVAGGRAEISINDTSNKQSLTLNFDRGDKVVTSNNTDTLETDVSSQRTVVRMEATLSRFGTQADSPSTGINSQELDVQTLKADLSDLRLFLEEQFDTSIADLLRAAASRSDSVWEYRREDGVQSVEFAQTGQRTASTDGQLSDYEVSVTNAETLEKAVVKGSLSQRSNEPFTANHGTAVDLDKTDIQRGKESVVDPSTGTAYEREVDYVLDPSAGTITTLADGEITDGQSLEISYPYQTSGSFGSGSATPQTTRTFEIPELPSDRACEIAALNLKRNLDEPLQSIRVEATDLPPTWSIMTAVSPSDLPDTVEFPLTINSISVGGGSATLEMESRQQARDLIEDIREQLQAVSKVS